MYELLTMKESKAFLRKFCERKDVTRLFLVCGKSWYQTELNKYLNCLAEEGLAEIIYFSNFKPNPQYESAMEGKDTFLSTSCNAIIGAGGGSAMDVAKCVKYFASNRTIPFLAIPTTAGTGSEATSFAVIYKDGEKQSVEDQRILPDAALLSPEVLAELPLYQKKVTMLDALSHGIESYWSIHTTNKSKRLAASSIRLIMAWWKEYLKNTQSGNQNMMSAANLAGQAINLTKTTAAHAMSYKLTSIYGIPHGMAAAICIPEAWRYLLSHMEDASDRRGPRSLSVMLEELSMLMGGSSIEDGVCIVEELLSQLALEMPKAANDRELEILVHSVNTQRLDNYPVILDQTALKKMYTNILVKKER